MSVVLPIGCGVFGAVANIAHCQASKEIMNNYQPDEQWSFSWVVPVFNLVGKAFCVGVWGVCSAICIVGVVTAQAIKEKLSE